MVDYDGVELRFGREACMFTGSKTLDTRSRTKKAKVEDVAFTAPESSRRTGICIKAIDFPTAGTGRIDPVAVPMQRARDEALSYVLAIGS
jgi:hypothetical protein